MRSTDLHDQKLKIDEKWGETTNKGEKMKIREKKISLEL